jgi:hypothetical protein
MKSVPVVGRPDSIQNLPDSIQDMFLDKISRQVRSRPARSLLAPLRAYGLELGRAENSLQDSTENRST